MGTLLGKKPFIRFSLLTSSHFCPKPFFFQTGFFLQIRTVHKYKIYRNGNNYFLQIRIVRSEPLCPDFCQGTLQSLNLRFWGKIEQNWCLRRIKDGESSLMRTDSHSERISWAITWILLLDRSQLWKYVDDQEYENKYKYIHEACSMYYISLFSGLG